MDILSLLLAVTVAVRGMGAGIIYDVALVSLPLRHQLGVVPYAKYARANFKGGSKTFVFVSILGALLTFIVAIEAYIQGVSSVTAWAITISVISTILAFIGTSRALPAMLSLQDAPDEEVLLKKILNKFAKWHAFSTIWQVISFFALVVALAYL